MTLIFENDNDVIVYAFENIICYARKNQYIFVAQSIWWIASVIGLTDGLVTHINNLRVRSEADRLPLEVEQLSIGAKVSTEPKDQPRINIKGSGVHPDRISQVNDTVNSSYEIESSEPELESASKVIQNAKKFINQSRKERRALAIKPSVLSCTRSGKILSKPLNQKQRNRLQAISKDTLIKYLESRK